MILDTPSDEGVDAGSQYTSIAFAETLVLEGIAASIGSIGDAYGNALAETTIGLFKTEAVGRPGPFLAGQLRTIDDVEYTTMKWVDWYNTHRLHSQLNYIPPDEYETAYYAHPQAFLHADRGPGRSFAKDAAPSGRRGQTRIQIRGWPRGLAAMPPSMLACLPP